MLFFIFLAILLIGIITYEIFQNRYALIALVIGMITVVVSLVIFGENYIGANGFIADNNQRYESLVYQYEENLYDNDNDIGQKELMNQIQEWNEDVAWYQAMETDFWIGIYIPNIFDQFKLIELYKE